MNDESSPKLANAVLDLSAAVNGLRGMNERLLYEIREGESAAEDRERGHTDALLKLHALVGSSVGSVLAAVAALQAIIVTARTAEKDSEKVTLAKLFKESPFRTQVLVVVLFIVLLVFAGHGIIKAIPQL